MKKGIVIVVITAVVSMSFSWFIEGAFAFKKRADVLITYNYAVRVPPRPPGWPQVWLAREIIKSFIDNKLKLNQTGNVSEDEIDILHADIKDGVKFSIRSDEQIRSGCVLEFGKKNDFEIIQSHYLELNNNNELHTWSLVKDNILVVIDGAMSEKEIQGYKAVLADME